MTPPVQTPARPTLEFPARQRARIEVWACSRYPLEACGLLLGRSTGARVTVVDVRLARNLVPARDRYELDPLDHLDAEEHAREHGLEVVGVWHSHPDHPAVPSESDRAGAWEGWSYAIVSVNADEVLALRSWRLAGAVFDEEEVLP